MITRGHVGSAYPDLDLRVESSAPGKAIIVGEHAVVYGARAIALPVSRARIRLSFKAHPTVQASRIFLGGQDVTDHLEGLLSEVFELLKVEPIALTIEGISSVVIGAGMGSSASLCVSLLSGIARLYHIDLSRRDLATYANRLERRFHGNPSGLDTSVVALERPILFQKGSDVKILTPQHPSDGPWSFALIDSGTRAATSTMVEKAKPYFMGELGHQRIKAFDDLSHHVSHALTQGDLLGVSESMKTAQAYLEEAQVVTPPLSKIIKDCEELGVLSAKITGAGGGGCILALLDPQNAGITFEKLSCAFGASRTLGVTCD